MDNKCALHRSAHVKGFHNVLEQGKTWR
uniref:Uncharacterized protein n=1 Tax=Arundo donax TaxID=35708 RepID=A0A0A9HC31_ARUDO